MDIGYEEAPPRGRDFAGEVLAGPGSAEEKLDRALKLLSVATRHFELSADPSFVADESLRILHCNAAFARLAGRSDVSGSALESLFPEPEGGAFVAGLRASARRDGFWEGEAPRRGGAAGRVERLTLASVRGPAAAAFVGIIRDVSELRRAEARLAYSENHDALTGLPNRQQYLAALDALIARRRREAAAAPADSRGSGDGAGALVACVLDLDSFKRFNNDATREVGDDLLRSVAGRLAESVRQADFLARTGGDEFSLCFAVGDGAEPEDLADRVLSVFDSPFRVRGRLYHLSASMGLARWPEHGSSAEELAAAADLALQSRKAAGRRSFCVYDAGLKDRLVGEASLEGELRQALAAGGITVHYQPIVRARGLEISGVEALVRWNRAEGPVSPARFIPLAEAGGLVSELGDRVLAQACAWRASLGIDASLPFVVNVNCSALQLQEPGFAAKLARAIAALGLSPSQFAFEITESGLVGDLAAASEVVEEIRATGARVLVDDFGVGFASLSYLKNLPVDGVKIDQSFVADLPGSQHSRGIVEAVVFLARELGIETIAEGVETEAQLDAIREIGCDHVQGYLVSRALPAGEIDRFLGPDARWRR